MISKFINKIGVDLKAGFQGNVSVEVCNGEKGGIVSPQHTFVCIGGFVELGFEVPERDLIQGGT